MRPPARRCAYCGAPTTVHPGQLREQGMLARLPHSPLRAGLTPPCLLSRAGEAKAA